MKHRWSAAYTKHTYFGVCWGLSGSGRRVTSAECGNFGHLGFALHIIYGGSSIQRRILFSHSLVQQTQLTYKWIIQVDNGFLEAIVRGYKAGILSQNQYANLAQCESLEGIHSLVLPCHFSQLWRVFFSRFQNTTVSDWLWQLSCQRTSSHFNIHHFRQSNSDIGRAVQLLA